MTNSVKNTLVKVKFHKSLLPFTFGRREIEIEHGTYLEIINSCLCLFPKLKSIFYKISNRQTKHEELIFVADGKYVPVADILFPAKREITLVPLIYGEGKMSGVLQIVVGIVLIAAVLFTTIFTFGTTTPAAALAVGAAMQLTFAGTILLGLGVSLLLGGIMSFFQPGQKAGGTGQPTRNNDAFDGIVNTTTLNIPVGLNYGLIRVGGQIVSASVTTIEHDKNRVVSVSEFFT